MNLTEDPDVISTIPDRPAALRSPAGDPDAWNAARTRAEDFLRAHRLPDARRRRRLAEGIVARAAALQDADPGMDPMSLVMREAAALVEKRNLPGDFARALRAGSIRAVPDLALARMVTRPLALGPLAEAAGVTIKRIERWPLLRTLLVGLLFFGALAAIF